ncbi:MAG: ribosome biogenesis GTP-binding protein YihA/YsxC [Bacilli bacterium]|nr:ribosome biogenesis GTP-binding protein YihA/YsxC [Bacilli bacterium]
MFDKCEFITSTTNRKQSPNKSNLNEFVFLGRSNVGKSSIINAVTRRKLLAKTSSKPGKTITLNYFLIDDKFYLVDVPGYGYASRSKDQRVGFGASIEDYLINNPNLKIAFLLVDTKVGPTKDDILMYNYMMHYGINIQIITTKADKVPTTLRFKAIKEIKQKLQNDNIIVTSAEKKMGINEIVELISNINN